MQPVVTPASVPGAGPPPRKPLLRRWPVWAVIGIVVAAAVGAGYVLFFAAPPNRAPVAVIQASDLAPATYETVTLNGSASYDLDGDTFFFAWTLPDGSSSAQRTVNLILTSVGTFRVILTVTDDRGAHGVTNVSLITHPAPLYVGTNTPYPPFEFYEPSAGAVEGFDIDVGNNVTSRLAYRAVWQDFPDFTVLLSTVSTGGVEMAASAITSSGVIGAQRNTTMYFSIPYFEVTFGVLVGSASNLTCSTTACTPADLANRTVGIQSGTNEELWVDSELVSPGYIPPSDVYTYTSVTAVLSALQMGSIDLAILDAPTAASAANGTSFRIAGLISTGEQYSLAFPKDATGLALRDRVNTVLQGMMADGTLLAITAKWFVP